MTIAFTQSSAARFTDDGLLARLEAADTKGLDDLRFGVIRLDRAGIVVAYNSSESAAAGLSPDKVLGRHFFEAVAPCMNNFLVALRFESEPELDAMLDYVLTLRMRPTPARLRLMQSQSVLHSYVLVERI